MTLPMSVAAAAPLTCPNESVRTGPSSFLPDCRAYELVTPPDSNGRLLEAISTFTLGSPFDIFPVELASSERESFVYETFAGALASPTGGSGVFDVYRTARGTDGWNTEERLSRTSSDINWALPGGVSADHRYAFMNEHAVDYLRHPDGSFEFTGIGQLGNEPFAQGRYISPGGGHVIFSTGKGAAQSEWCSEAPTCQVAPVAPLAPSAGIGAVYDRPGTGLAHVVSLLPGDETPTSQSEQAFYKGAATSGTSIAFEIAETLYVRVDSGSATERTEQVAGGKPTFAGLSADGQYLFYVVGGETGTIHRFDTATEDDVEVNPVGEGSIVNLSGDGSHAYFVSEQQLDGAEGASGQPNLYVWVDGSINFIATLLPSDLEETSEPGFGTPGPSLTSWVEAVNPSAFFVTGPGIDSSRSTADGRKLVFESHAQIGLYDNAGHTEIYRYDDEDGGVICVSCNPGTKPVADAQLQDLTVMPPWVLVRNVSEDGSRVFFETKESLVPRDTNGANDIYEWPGPASSSSVDLISSGQGPTYPPWEGWRTSNPTPNVLLSITSDGSNVFFATSEALVPGAGENGTQGIYDARVGGGFPGPSASKFCLEEDCKAAASAVSSGALEAGSELGSTEGNVRPRKHHCGSGKRSKKNRNAKRRHCKKGHRKQGRSQAAAASITAAEEAADTSASVGAPVPGGDAAAISLAPGGATAASGPAEEFGVERWQAGFSSGGAPTEARAGTNPDFQTVVEFNHHQTAQGEEANAAVQSLRVDLPPGLLGNPTAVPACAQGNFSTFGNCSPATQVGVTRVKVGFPSHAAVIEPVYNLTPPHPEKEVARLGFIAFAFPVYLDISVRTASDYGVTATAHEPPGLGVLIRATTTLWGNPSSSVHDSERASPNEVGKCPLGKACEAPEEEWPSGIDPSDWKAFMTTPSACQSGEVGLLVTSYQLPGQTFTASAPLAPIVDCTGLPFSPTFSTEPTSHEAGAPTGLKTKLVLPQHLGADERTTATMREARVTLPEGMQVAAGAANWIGTCSDSQVGYHEEVDTACPDSSKLGTASFVSPALSVPIEGTIYQRAPEPGRQLGLWLTADALGLHIKLPGSLEPDKQTGRLTAVFSDLPQVPVQEIDLDVWGGPRAPLQNPDHCGTFTTDFSFTPHSDDPAATGQSTMQITEGCNQGFSPTLHAGVTDPTAGKYSPFVFDLTRPDGQQALRGFELHLPDGELAKIKGVPLCSDADAAAATCPLGSRIGRLQATTGPGPEPFTLPEPGKPQPQIYLAGPYQGAPFSILSEVPAQAGPFDLGTLAVRSGLAVEPATGRAVVKADPLPQFFEGVGIAYRNLHAVVDRPEFNLNPTDCRETAVTADVTSTQGTVAHPQARFQVDGCKALKFKPRLSLKLKGETKRASYPALSAVLNARKGDANIASTSVALPHSEFLAQEHIGTICTRVQFAADKCPKGSVYGKAKAITPLLDKPLSGPVYLRSSNHPLPDLVAKLGGELEIDLVGRIDSKNGGIRASFESVPDAPVTKFVLQMRGGKKSLLTNSTDICRGSHKATVQMKAQNGRQAQLRPVLQSSGCGKKKLGKHKHHH